MSEATHKGRRAEIRPLTSLRGVASMAVVMQHFCATAQEHCDTTIPSIPPHGYMAVDMFFFLSGFIIAYTHLEDFRALSLVGYPAFLRKRAARIVPLNLFVLAAIIVLGQASLALIGRNIIHPAADMPLDLVSNALMLQGLGVGTNLNGPSWSISTEVVAYLLFPLFAALIGLARPRLAGPAVALCVASLVALALTTPHLGLDTSTSAGNLVRCLTEFGTGVFIHRLYQRQTTIARIAGHDRVLAGAIIGSVVLLCLRLDLPAALLFPVIILGLATNRGHVAALMSNRVLHWFGLVSFSLYLIHQPFRSIGLELLRSVHPAPVGYFAALALAMAGAALVVPFAYLVHRYVERPGRNTVNALLGRFHPRTV